MLKAIETTYLNYRFRSRLEAKWACFLHTLGIPFEYEPQGYVVGGMAYLPDLWLPQQQCWLEIKGQDPTKEEHAKAYYLARESGHNVYVSRGAIIVPGDERDRSAFAMYCPKGFYPPIMRSYQEAEPQYVGAFEYEWTECLQCHLIELAPDGNPKFLSCRHRVGIWDNGEGTLSPWLVAAFQAAKMARFEHGRSGN